MRFVSCLILILLSAGFSTIKAQEETEFSFSEAAEKLAVLSESIIKDSLLTDREAAHKDFEALLTTTLEQPNSFDYPFEEVQAVSIQVPEDNSFRIFTWQLFVDNKTYKYGGLIQKNTPTPTLYSLSDQSAELPLYDMEYATLSPEDWYGAIYYNIQEFDSLEQKKYLLFGYDGFEFFNKRKVAEVLSFDEEGVPVFGAPVFSKAVEGYAASTKNRLYLEYDASIAVRLNYDESLGVLIHDHLIQMKGQYRGQGMVNVPDGSYEGYYYKNGVWNYKEKIFDLVSETPPRSKPVLGTIKKTLFGKKVDKN